MSTILLIHHLKQIGKVKKFNEWMPCEPTENKKNRFEVSSLIVHKNNEPFLDQDCEIIHEKCILYDNQL